MAGDESIPGADYDPLYLRGIEMFNACEDYESHEIWEELWTEYRGPSRRFYQALIQAADTRSRVPPRSRGSRSTRRR